MKFDLHLHTSRHSPDSRMHPDALCRRAEAIGLDGFVITEHDWLWTETELDELRRAYPGLVILAGVEVSTREGHFLAYGLRDPFATPRGIGCADLCREVHRQGGVVVAAHPFRWGQKFDEILERHRPRIDGMELMTNNMDADVRRMAARTHARIGVAGLGSSDAHDDHVLGFCYTQFDRPIRGIGDLVEAIRAKGTSACERASAEALVAAS